VASRSEGYGAVTDHAGSHQPHGGAWAFSSEGRRVRLRIQTPAENTGERDLHEPVEIVEDGDKHDNDDGDGGVGYPFSPPSPISIYVYICIYIFIRRRSTSHPGDGQNSQLELLIHRTIKIVSCGLARPSLCPISRIHVPIRHSRTAGMSPDQCFNDITNSADYPSMKPHLQAIAATFGRGMLESLERTWQPYMSRFDGEYSVKNMTPELEHQCSLTDTSNDMNERPHARLDYDRKRSWNKAPGVIGGAVISKTGGYHQLPPTPPKLKHKRAKVAAKELPGRGVGLGFGTDTHLHDVLYGRDGMSRGGREGYQAAQKQRWKDDRVDGAANHQRMKDEKSTKEQEKRTAKVAKSKSKRGARAGGGGRGGGGGEEEEEEEEVYTAKKSRSRGGGGA